MEDIITKTLAFAGLFVNLFALAGGTYLVKKWGFRTIFSYKLAPSIYFLNFVAVITDLLIFFGFTWIGIGVLATGILLATAVYVFRLNQP